MVISGRRDGLELHAALTASPDTAAMQIGSGASPLTLAVLKTLGNQAGLGAPAGSSSAAGASAANATGSVLGALPAAVSGGVSNAVSTSTASDQTVAAAPPEPGRVFPRGSFVDLKA